MSHVVRYEIDGRVVGFEIDPVEGFTPAGFEQVVGGLHAAMEPAMLAARTVLSQVAELGPEGVEVRFGLKVTGTANWLVAKAATEGNFEVTLSWRPDRRSAPLSAARQ